MKSTVMKRCMVFLLIVNALLLAGRFWQELKHDAEAQTATENGDVNGDSFRDVGDVVYMLWWLFKGGPEPVVFAGGGGSGLTPEQEEILSHMSIVESPDGQGGSCTTIRISRANLQIVNGLGVTDRTNCLGNLVVGYNETRGGDNERIGSHNVIVGSRHNHSSYGGIVVGLQNTISGAYAAVTGGASNTAAGESSSVSGGENNIAVGLASAVSGGRENAASNLGSSVSGGAENRANGIDASVTSGQSNIADGDLSSVTGGLGNTAAANYSTVSGGEGTTANAAGSHPNTH